MELATPGSAVRLASVYFVATRPGLHGSKQWASEKKSQQNRKRKLFAILEHLSMFHFYFQSVNNLSIETRKVVKGNHSRKTANFVRVKSSSL